MTTRRNAGRSWAVAVALVLAPVIAEAQPSEPVDKAKALEIGHHALGAFEQGRWEEALARFDEAESITHSPVFVLYRARSKRNLGRLLAAREDLRALAAEVIPEDAPVAWRQAQRDGRAELTALGPRIPSLLVKVEGGEPTDVRVDGEPIAIGVAADFDPGRRDIVARRGGDVVWRTSVTLQEGAPTITAVVPGDRPAAGAPALPMWPGAVLLGLGGAGVVAGAVTGAIAAGKTSDLEEQCGDDDNCPPALEGDGDAAEAFALASTIGFIAGGVAAAAGVTWLVVAPSSADEAAVAVWLDIAPRGLALRGAF